MLDPRQRARLMRIARRWIRRTTGHEVSLTTLYTLWRRWLQRGMKDNALLPDYCDRAR